MGRRSVRKQPLSRHEQNVLKGASGDQVQKPKKAIDPAMCVFCQIRPAVSREHVFPRCFFEEPRPTLLTVPTCVECNSGTGDGGPRPMSQDEEYVRNMFCMMEGATKHPVAMNVLHKKVFKSLERSPALNSLFLKTMRPVLLQNSAGIITPELKYQFSFELPRVTRVLRKITKGLFAYYMGRPFPTDAHIEMAPRLDQHAVDVAAKMIDSGPHLGPIEIQNKTVVFSGVRNGPQLDTTMWLMVFYQSYAACTTTMTRQQAIEAGMI